MSAVSFCIGIFPAVFSQLSDAGKQNIRCLGTCQGERIDVLAREKIAGFPDAWRSDYGCGWEPTETVGLYSRPVSGRRITAAR